MVQVWCSCQVPLTCFLCVFVDTKSPSRTVRMLVNDSIVMKNMMSVEDKAGGLYEQEKKRICFPKISASDFQTDSQTFHM